MGGGGGGANSRSTSTSSVGNMGAMHDPSLKKLTKDLHRCEVSIARYQTMLNEVGAVCAWCSLNPITSVRVMSN